MDDDAHPTPDAQLGLAEFSNGNFLGEDAIYCDASPRPKPSQTFQFPSLISSTTLPQLFYSMMAYDDYAQYRDGSSGVHVYIRKKSDGVDVPHHSRLEWLTASLRYSRGMSFPTLDAVGVTINDPNVLNDYHAILLPKAIKYSAGILDYFFRGQIETSVRQVSGTYKLRITNRSGQPLNGGTVKLFYDDSNGLRQEATAAHFIMPPLTAIADNGYVDADFSPVPEAVAYILVYKGTIGSAAAPDLDSVDANIAIAAKVFYIPWAYYNMDSVQSGEVPELIAGRTLALSTGYGWPTIGPGKLGSAYVSEPYDPWLAYRQNDDMRLAQQDFTVRFWFRTDSPDFGLPAYYNYFGGGGRWTIENATDELGILHLAFAVYADALPRVVSPAVSLNQWHEVVVWCRVGREVGIRVDNGVKITAPFSSGFPPPGSPPELDLYPGWSWARATTFEMDEVAIWKGHALTDAELEADWNNGSGRTWPW